MTAAVVVAPQRPSMLMFRRSLRQDRQVREESQQKRAEIYQAIERDPDADPGLRRQAETYRRRLESGMEGPNDPH